VEADGSLRVVPVEPPPVKAFRSMDRRGGSSQRLLANREAERQGAMTLAASLPEMELSVLSQQVVQ
jgi:hypothetical protein